MNLRIFAPGQFRNDGAAVPNTYPADASGIVRDAPVPNAALGFHILQRITDVLLASIMLLLLLPVCIVVAIVIKLDSPGPVLFKQKRVGQDGELFWFYKFRSMVQDAEARRNALMQMNEADGALFKIKNDPRITGVGRFIRKTSLDELPQLFNVLKGEMSLVGPRPALPVEVAQYNARQRVRLQAKPGITGLWQVSGRSDLPFERSIELDLDYVAHQSYSLYIRILLMTLPAVLKGKGAY